MSDGIRFLLIAIAASMNLGFVRSEASQSIREGNALYRDGDLDGALARYNDAQLSEPASPEILFNMGDVFYRQKKYAEALDSFRKVLEKADGGLEAKAYYNIGNALFQQGQLREALEAYKQALERDPDDVDAKYNIEYTERKIKEMLSQAQQTMAQAIEEQARRERAASGEAGEDAGEGREQQQAVGMTDEPQGGERAQEDEAGQSPEEAEDRGATAQGAQVDEEDGGEELSKEEAERVLSAFEQGQEGVVPQQQRPARARGSYVEKDW